MRGQRFVIVSHLRSGTHMLRAALDSHPGIQCRGEPFNANSDSLPYPLSTRTADVLRHWALPTIPGVRAVGFVLQSYHPFSLRAFPTIRANPTWGDVWERLAAMADLRVVFLQRENLLRRHLSQMLAMRRGYWHSWRSDRVMHVHHLYPPEREQIGTRPPDAHPIVLDPQRLIADFEEIVELRERASRLFAKHASLRVRYEDLVARPAAHHQSICRFLSVDVRSLQSATNRMETRPLSASIANYRELEELFKNTRWRGFFDE